jgi:hypothetical protein
MDAGHTPSSNPHGKPAKKLVDEEVRILQTGTSSLTPEQLADSWESATIVKEKNPSRSRNNLNVNGKITRILSLSTQTDPVERVELEASREPNSKVTQVEISSPLPMPDIETEYRTLQCLTDGCHVERSETPLVHFDCPCTQN